MIWRIIFVSVLFTAGTLGIFFHALCRGSDLATARTLVVNALGGAGDLLSVQRALPRLRLAHLAGASSARRRCCWRWAWWWLRQLAFTYLPPMQAVFDIPPRDMGGRRGVILGAGVALMAVTGD